MADAEAKARAREEIRARVALKRANKLAEQQKNEAAASETDAKDASAAKPRSPRAEADSKPRSRSPMTSPRGSAVSRPEPPPGVDVKTGAKPRSPRRERSEAGDSTRSPLSSPRGSTVSSTSPRAGVGRKPRPANDAVVKESSPEKDVGKDAGLEKQSPRAGAQRKLRSEKEPEKDKLENSTDTSSGEAVAQARGIHIGTRSSPVTVTPASVGGVTPPMRSPRSPRTSASTPESSEPVIQTSPRSLGSSRASRSPRSSSSQSRSLREEEDVSLEISPLGSQRVSRSSSGMSGDVTPAPQEKHMTIESTHVASRPAEEEAKSHPTSPRGSFVQSADRKSSPRAMVRVSPRSSRTQSIDMASSRRSGSEKPTSPRLAALERRSGSPGGSPRETLKDSKKQTSVAALKLSVLKEKAQGADAEGVEEDVCEEDMPPLPVAPAGDSEGEEEPVAPSLEVDVFGDPIEVWRKKKDKPKKEKKSVSLFAESIIEDPFGTESDDPFADERPPDMARAAANGDNELDEDCFVEEPVVESKNDASPTAVHVLDESLKQGQGLSSVAKVDPVVEQDQNLFAKSSDGGSESIESENAFGESSSLRATEAEKSEDKEKEKEDDEPWNMNEEVQHSSDRAESRKPVIVEAKSAEEMREIGTSSFGEGLSLRLSGSSSGSSSSVFESSASAASSRSSSTAHGLPRLSSVSPASSRESRKKLSLGGLSDGEGAFAEDSDDLFGPISDAPESRFVPEKEPECLADLLPVEPDNLEPNELVYFLRSVRDTLSNRASIPTAFWHELEAEWQRQYDRLNVLVRVDRPERNDFRCLFAEVIAGWVEHRLAKPSVKHKCRAVFNLIEEAETMLRDMLGDAYITWGKRESHVLETLKALKKRAIVLDSAVLARMAGTLQDQLKEADRLKKSLAEKEELMRKRGMKL